MTEREKYIIRRLNLNESDFERHDPQQATSVAPNVEDRISELEVAIDALLKGETE